MERHLTSWYSPRLEKEMPIAVYGTYGFALLLIPTAAADFLEYERFQLIESLRPFIDGGKVKVFSIDSINCNDAPRGSRPHGAVNESATTPVTSVRST